jgi:hypothetical protein
MGSIGIGRRGAAILFAIALGAGGCGGGYDEDEAQAVCNALVGNVDTAPSGLYAECVACYTECGDDCAMAESDPPQFNCPE